jgi:hypothetical protein
MCDHLGTGPDAMYTLATTVAYRAMAEAGLKKADDADWYAHVAFSLHPKLAERDWSAYGEVGEWLSKTKHEAELQAADEGPPRVPLRRNDPKCPLSAIQGGYYQPVTISATVDGEGNVRCPRLISKTVAPTLIYTAFESLRDFQFGPGAPVSYELTVHFNPPAP